MKGNHLADTTSLPAWWSALRARGLGDLSPPELAHAIQELTLDRAAFLGVLEAAADYPHTDIFGERPVDEAALDQLDRMLPRSRAVVDPTDEPAVMAAARRFEVVLALDPAWHAATLLYEGWHAAGGLSDQHARDLLLLAAPGLRLRPLVELSALRFIPNTLPGSWQATPPPRRLPRDASSALRTSVALHRAARLLHWGDRLHAVAVASEPATAAYLRTVAACGADLQGVRSEAALVLSVHETLQDALARRWPARMMRGWWSGRTREIGRAAPDPARLADRLGAADNAMGPARRWRLGVGQAALPDVALAFMRVSAGRRVREGIPGAPIPLRRRPMYLAAEAVRSASVTRPVTLGQWSA